LKIAYLVNQYPKVSHTFIRREILALERQGFEVLRVALRGWDESIPDEADREEQRRTRYVLREGAAGLLIPCLAAIVRSPRRFLRALAMALRMSRDSDRALFYHVVYFAEACRVFFWLVEFGAKHIHAHFGTNSAEVGMLVHALGGPPFSFTVHGPDEFLNPMGLEKKIHQASFVIAISSFGRSQLLIHAIHDDWPKIKIVHCGLERAFYASTGAPIGASPRLVCVGRLCEAKGQLLLVEAAARLNAKGIAVELVLAGDGPMRGQIEEAIRDYRLEGRVRITGWISSARVRDEILAARALVLPSFAEGLPVVIMEAMALRRPVLTTYIAGIPELVRPGQTGWLFPAGSADELARAMEECLAKSPEELETMGNAGYDRVLARHFIDTEASKLGSLFETVAGAGFATQYGDTQPASES
jgi:colanic acid/amylovoran biosynthesis glycosyltransferase